MHPNHGAIWLLLFLAICQKLKKNYGILKFFLTQDHMQLEISKYYFSHNFYWSPFKLYGNTSYHGISKCLLEYCMRSWHLVPKRTYSI